MSGRAPEPGTAAGASRPRVASIWRVPYEALTTAVATLGEALSATAGPHEGAAAEHSPPALWTRTPQTIVVLDPDRRVVDAGEQADRVLGRPPADLIGRRLVLIPWAGGRGRVDVVWPDGSVHALEFVATAASPGAGQLVALREVTGAGTSDVLPAARDLKHALMADLRAPDRDPYALIDVLGGRLAAALGADRVGVFESSGPRRPLLLRAGAGWAPGAIGHATVGGAADAPIGRALALAEPVVIGDLRRLSSSAPALLREAGVISGMEVAIRPHSRPWGVLGAYSTTARRFAADEVDYLCAVADTLALALDCAGIEWRTREEIAQLLHDDALQSLLTARQYLASPAAEDVRRDHVVRARDALHHAIRELRAVVSDLHPVVDDAARLREAIEAAVARQSRRGGFAATVDLELDPDGAWGPLLLSLIGELMANVAEHARARHVSLRLTRHRAGLALEVSDDGVGIRPGRVEQALADGHIGLASAARRVRALGGELTIDGTAGMGTRVRIELPWAGWPGPAAGGAGTGAG